MTLLNSRSSDKIPGSQNPAQGMVFGTARSASASTSQDAMKEGEEKLITSAFFKLGIACHRDSVDQRFALLTAGQSFLARQRQAGPRKPLHTLKSK